MNWRLINKDPSKQPRNGNYSDWKNQIAIECFYQCVYCSIHEAQFGGIDNYHIDHFRPKSRKEFEQLTNDICNLFYACPICNRFKSDDWPGEPDLNTSSYPDPSKVDYTTLFRLTNDFELEGLYTASKYLILRLFLNRFQLIMERREATRRAQVQGLIEIITGLVDSLTRPDIEFALDIMKKLDSIKNNLLGLEEHRRRIRPYEIADIRKP